IEELVTKIQPLSSDIIKAARKRFDNLIKPVGSLAQLEDMTARYAGILGSSDKRLVVIPETRLLLLWGEAKHAADIEAVMLQKKAVSVYASHVNAKVIPLLVIGESAYDLLEEGAMLTGEYIGEEKAGLICLGTFENDLRPDWQDLSEEDGLAFLDRLQCPSVSAMTGAILQAAGMRVPIMLDGVATCLAALAAARMNPYVLQYCFAGDESAEAGSSTLLQRLQLQAPLRLSLHNAQGVGALTCLRLFDAGIKAYREMETFEEAGVHAEKEDYSLKVQEDKKLKG
ncbi:MAG: nicotinate-nucleotide--dimethylbenzimidazole phosphoribosyltransferase, partial [Acidaminococcaceae bacterium]|nr:nicotinate-nucleotide--dimethylbenzimidazole phosphoribosyltransferase [Acidaminococcaceae bacterium]